MLLDRLYLLRSVIVEDAEQVVIRADNNPLLPGNELSATYWRVRDFD